MAKQFCYLIYYGVYGSCFDGSSVEIEANSIMHADVLVGGIPGKEEEKRKFIEAIKAKLESDTKHARPDISSCQIIIKNIILL